MFSRYPDARVTVIVLSNIDRAPTERIANDLAAIVFGQPYELPRLREAIQVDPAIYEAYVGRYELAPGLIFTVTTDTGRIFAQLTGQDRFEIYSESKTEFFYEVVDAQLTFVVDSNGAVTGLNLRQGGQDISARKVD